VASIALPLLVLLLRDDAAEEVQDRTPLRNPVTIGMLVGCLGMPAVLVLASLIDHRLKFLLPIPALGVTAAVVVNLFAARNRPRLERWGLTWIAISMTLGLVIGLWAFAGPLTAPPTQEAYNGFERRLVRLGHAYTIVLGLMAIAAARSGWSRGTAGLFAAAATATILGIGVVGSWGAAPLWLLACGPLLVALSIVAGAWKAWGARGGGGNA
jgi:hypothetical protein